MRSLPLKFALVLAAGIGLSGCAQITQSQMNLSSDFGDALRADLAAQIADPDAHYTGTPAPGSSGARVDLAQTRYGKNQVIQPSTTTASGSRSIGNADNGNSGGTGGTAMGATSQ